MPQSGDNWANFRKKLTIKNILALCSHRLSWLETCNNQDKVMLRVACENGLQECHKRFD